ncbi:MAG: HEAT repeat domain-containing protein [Deltaproteobacteria bacterium]|nr:HEAT repeat domain-containing protein [Deltaproteobacteria bacterium]
MRAAGAIEKPSEVPFNFANQGYESTEELVYNILIGYPIQIENPSLGILKQYPWGISASEVASAYIEIGSPGNVVCIKQWPQQFIRGAISSICAIPQMANTVESEFLWAESATVKKKQEKEFESEIWALFEAANDEIFEDGIESRFSKDLIKLIITFGNDAVTFITDSIISGHANPEVASEALRWIGRMNHPQSYSNRLWLLESCLNCASSKMRDGAILGLASMDNPNAIPYIKNAMEREYLVELKQDMQQVIDQLENTIGGIHFAEGKEKSVV